MTDLLFFRGDYSLTPIDVPALLLGLMLAFLLGQLLAWVYMLTHSGLSYSKSFVSALVLTPVVVSMVMGVLANNLVTAFGLMAVFAIVRFRNILRDTLDTSYVLAVIVIGMACGTKKFSTAVVGCLVVALILIYLWNTEFGRRHRFDMILNLHWARPATDLGELHALLHRHSRRTQFASQRTHEGYEGVDLSFRLLMRDPARADEMIADLNSLEGISRVTTLKAEEESEL